MASRLSILSNPDYRHGLIPGGAHTYSRGDDTFPEIAPAVLVRGKGSVVSSLSGSRYVDWAMSLRSVVLGHSHPTVVRAVKRAARAGNNLARPVPEEFLLAEELRALIPSAEMVKFGKNGSDATDAAVRLARAATGRPKVLRSSADAFLGVHDWFIGSTVMNRGVPEAVVDMTESFQFGSIEALETSLLKNRGQVAAVVMEPAGSEIPTKEYLQSVRSLVSEHGAVLVFDETVSGFRVSESGAQGYFGVTPDLSTFGKAMGNGYPLSALTGRRDLMELGGIRHSSERVFLMSSTYGAERTGLLAGLATLSVLARKPVIERVWDVGSQIQSNIGIIVKELKLNDYVHISGLPCSPIVTFARSDGTADLVLKTIFMEQLFTQGHFVSSNLFSPAYSHSDRQVKGLVRAVHRALTTVQKATQSLDPSDFLLGRPILPVFRKKNF